VPSAALEARIASSVRLWGFNAEDTILSLGLQADAAPAVVDTVMAPLSVGARVAFAQLQQLAEDQVWDLWAALMEEEDATVIFIRADWCWRLLDAYDQLAREHQKRFARRLTAQPLRHCIVVASPGTPPSKDMARRWADIFQCQPTWYYSCAEAGPLFVVSPVNGELTEDLVGHCAEGLSWKILDGELWVSGDMLFESYHDRPRSSAEAFDKERAFCRTGHPVSVSNAGGAEILPEPFLYDKFLEKDVYKHMYLGPMQDDTKMKAHWGVKRVNFIKWPLRKTKTGFIVPTRKPTNVDIIYKPKYKKQRK